uniref:Uncharacterized protein n=1 Tax=Apteryx owenii TaxID=8824 RepID=A0A8B9NZS0_APTOW
MHPHPLDPEGSIWYSQICALVVRAAIKPQCKTKAENKAMLTIKLVCVRKSAC